MPARFKPQRLALGFLWIALGLLFAGIGLQKLTAYEASAVRPFVGTSPFLAWTYGLLGVRGASFLFAAIELPIGLGLFWGAVRPRTGIARLAAAGAAVTAFVTTSFVFTAPGAVVVRHGLPLLSLSVGQLFVKDLVLLAGALVLLAEGSRR